MSLRQIKMFSVSNLDEIQALSLTNYTLSSSYQISDSVQSKLTRSFPATRIYLS